MATTSNVSSLYMVLGRRGSPQQRLTRSGAYRLSLSHCRAVSRMGWGSPSFIQLRYMSRYSTCRSTGPVPDFGTPRKEKPSFFQSSMWTLAMFSTAPHQILARCWGVALKYNPNVWYGGYSGGTTPLSLAMT